MAVTGFMCAAGRKAGRIEMPVTTEVMKTSEMSTHFADDDELLRQQHELNALRQRHVHRVEHEPNHHAGDSGEPGEQPEQKPLGDEHAQHGEALHADGAQGSDFTRAATNADPHDDHDADADDAEQHDGEEERERAHEVDGPRGEAHLVVPVGEVERSTLRG